MDEKKQRLVFNLDLYSFYSDRYFSQHDFMAFFLLKYSNFREFIKLKKILSSLGFELLIPRNQFFKKISNSNLSFFKKMHHNKLVMMYLCRPKDMFVIKDLISVLKSYTYVVPFFFYAHSKIMYLHDLFCLEYDEKRILDFFTWFILLYFYNMVVLLFFYNKFLVYVYEFYKSIKKN